MITQIELKQMLYYDSDTGIFNWKLRPANRIKIGDKAGRKFHDSYIGIKVNKKEYMAHRLAWLYVTGSWPDNEIDHINGIRYDNRFCNLRDVTHSQNMQNQRKVREGTKNNLMGVTNNGNKFQAQIKVDGNYKYLGLFDSAELANQAYLNAKRELHEYCTI